MLGFHSFLLGPFWAAFSSFPTAEPNKTDLPLARPPENPRDVRAGALAQGGRVSAQWAVPPGAGRRPLRGGTHLGVCSSREGLVGPPVGVAQGGCECVWWGGRGKRCRGDLGPRAAQRGTGRAARDPLRVPDVGGVSHPAGGGGPAGPGSVGAGRGLTRGGGGGSGGGAAAGAGEQDPGRGEDGEGGGAGSGSWRAPAGPPHPGRGR